MRRTWLLIGQIKEFDFKQVVLVILLRGADLNAIAKACSMLPTCLIYAEAPLVTAMSNDDRRQYTAPDLL